MYTSFSSLISDIWGAPHIMAADIGATIPQARKWKTRDSIPPEYWSEMAVAAHKRGKKLTVDNLATIAASKRTGAAA